MDNRLSFRENNCNHEYDDDGSIGDGITKGTDVNTNYGSIMKLWAKACEMTDCVSAVCYCYDEVGISCQQHCAHVVLSINCVLFSFFLCVCVCVRACVRASVSLFVVPNFNRGDIIQNIQHHSRYRDTHNHHRTV